MPNCSINGCKTTSLNAKHKKLKLFSFPKNRETREKWISACKKPYKFNDNNARICSKHFPEESFEKPMIQKMLNYSPVNSRKLRPNAVPTQYLPPFAESEVKIDTLCNEIENIPMDEVEGDKSTPPVFIATDDKSSPPTTEKDKSLDSVTDIDPLSDQSPNQTKTSKAARIAYETLLTTYQKFFTENEELRIKNKTLKGECEKHRKLYEKRLTENIKLRQRNRALLNENQKLRNRLKKMEGNSKMEYEITDVVECCITDDVDTKSENENKEAEVPCDV